MMIGAGGMGEVYRARDTKLGRDVAIKILTADFTADPERRARFAREARLLATLNHPHIGAIYGLEESAGIAALVLEFVDGPTLANRLEHGPLPIVEALAIARQIAEALEAAHEQGIVHRDLKPANIILQGGGGGTAGPVRAKVLDFGLAKSTAMNLAADLTRESSLAGTEDGRILGTPAYMSPEQARGAPVDKRTDIWAFGCVLFEMLSGRRAFEGNTGADTLARVLEREPDWTALPGATPDAIRTLLRRCFVKDPARRPRDIGDLRLELEEPATLVPSAAGPTRSQKARHSLSFVVIALVAVVAAALGWGVLQRRTASSPSSELVEFAIFPPEKESFSGTSPQFAISPDGRQVTFVASASTGTILWLRSLSTVDARVVAGTEGARNPFWSPDSQSIAYFANGRLKTVRVSGGSPIDVCPVGRTDGASASTGAWRGDVIIFSTSGMGLRQVSSKGGKPTSVTTLDQPGQSHRYPSFLPDGSHFLYLASQDTHELRVGSLASSSSEPLGTFESHASYGAGHILFVRGGNLMAQAFDADTRRVNGAALPLGVQAGVDPPWARGMFSVSDSGRIVYRREARTPSQLTWLDRNGRVVGTLGEPGVFFNVDLSPDGKRVAISQLTQQAGDKADFDIGVMDVATGRMTRLTDDPAWEFDPAWSPDGNRVAFNSNRPDPSTNSWALYTRAADGSGEDVAVVKVDAASFSSPDWSSTNILAYDGGSSSNDIWTLSMKGSGEPMPFIRSKMEERHPAFSPDGRWVAYHSNASGRLEVYVRPFPQVEPVYPVSRSGGAYPHWSDDGKELFFVSPDGSMMVSSSDTVPGFVAVVPQRLFATPIRGGNNHPYAVAGDGRFLIPIPTNPPLRVILNGPATRR